MDVFNRYAPFIQDFIYQNSWESLRAIQVAAGEAVFSTQDNVLLSASTASGKTEAAFFPILTLFTEDRPSSVGAIYIGPLKALINDQFMRLNDLCKEAGIAVWHWHGDVAQSHKNKLVNNPSGILQITPESLEAMLLHRHADISRMFGDLRFVVIDEVHSLMRGDRGAQTLCLIERLSRLAGVNPRRIGLSATIGDLQSTGEFLGSGTGRGTVIPKINAKSNRWRLSMEHFFVSDHQAGDDYKTDKATNKQSSGTGDSVSKSSGDIKDDSGNEITDKFLYEEEGRGNASEPYLQPLDEKSDLAPANADPGMGYIFEHTRGKKCLVFVNSREECESVTTTLRRYCERRNEPDRFLIHHGNLSASYRETAEAVMKDDEQLQTTVTTATLELGIDIGRLERAFQIDAPFMVSSFLQRMGRTGRRGEPSEMWFVMREEIPESRAMLPVTIPWQLIQGIALVQLYIQERWVEPPKLDRLPFSLLYHQTMCTLASGGELSPAALASKVLTLSCFYRISQEDYKLLLRHLISIDHIQKTERGGLIVGLAGERQVNTYKFYAVFKENEEYTVRSKSQELGTIVMPPPVGEKIALAGHVWVVEEVDHKRHLVYCEEVKGNVPAYFGLCPGDINTKVLERMRQVLAETEQYPYLMKNAVARLGEARHSAVNSSMTVEPLICLGGDMWCLFPWLGSYAFLAMERFLKLKCAAQLGLSGMDSSRPYFIQFKMKADRKEFFRVLCETAMQPLDPMELIYKGETPLFEKYDEFLPEELVKKGFAHGILGIDEMLARIKGWESL